MSDDLRVPPSVTLSFERLVVAVCEEAKLDFEQWAPKTHEFVTHLQERWREGVEQGLSDTAAESRAVERFGSVAAVGRSLRPTWLRRYLTFQRYRGQRYALFLSGAVFCAYVETESMAATGGAKYEVGSVGFYYLLGCSLNGAVAAGALAIVKWRPSVRARVFKGLLACRWIVAPLMFTGLLNCVLPAFVIFPREVKAVIHTPSRLPMLAFVGFAACIGLVGTAGYLSELFEVPRRRSQRLQREILAAQAR